MSIIIPSHYENPLDVRQTQIAIKKVKDFFEQDLAIQLNLTRVSAPLFVRRDSGLNDTLNGVERPVAFDLMEEPDTTYEIVQSLAKWKRFALGEYGFEPGEGLYTDMSAIRRDEVRDNLHSCYVDQWDWERVITREARNEETLKRMVRRVYRALRHTEAYILREYHFSEPFLPKEIAFVTTQELEDRFPDQTPRQRETLIAKEKGAVFVMQIGGALKSGQIHDGRAPDYDDWTLNGDIIIYYPILDMALELSSMGIRVDEDALLRQLRIRGMEENAKLPFQQALLQHRLPYTVGGGIGQSRICMFCLRKAHVGEGRGGAWSEEDRAACKACGIHLL